MRARYDSALLQRTQMDGVIPCSYEESCQTDVHRHGHCWRGRAPQAPAWARSELFSPSSSTLLALSCRSVCAECVGSESLPWVVRAVRAGSQQHGRPESLGAAREPRPRRFMFSVGPRWVPHKSSAVSVGAAVSVVV